jgi:HrpA-like RNA helicase
MELEAAAPAAAVGVAAAAAAAAGAGAGAGAALPRQLTQLAGVHDGFTQIYPLDPAMDAALDLATVEAAAAAQAAEATAAARAAAQQDTLPIDEFKESILEHIRTHRVTIINGETGCGKSSRIPDFLLADEAARSSSSSLHSGNGNGNGNGRQRGGGAQVRVMVAQPRRIAASGLCSRMRSCR